MKTLTLLCAFWGLLAFEDIYADESQEVLIFESGRKLNGFSLYIFSDDQYVKHVRSPQQPISLNNSSPLERKKNETTETGSHSIVWKGQLKKGIYSSLLREFKRLWEIEQNTPYIQEIEDGGITLREIVVCTHSRIVRIKAISPSRATQKLEVQPDCPGDKAEVARLFLKAEEFAP